MKYLLDTDICIYYLKGNAKIKETIASINCEELSISIITQAELLYGAYNSEKVDENLAKIDMLKKSLKVTGLDEKSLNIYARTKAELKRKGGLIDEFDLLIASVAIANGLILVTNNKKHFDRISGLKLENWI